MNPVLETFMLVAIAIVVILAVVWAFGCFKPRVKDEPIEGTSVPRETAKPIIRDYKVFKAPDIKDNPKGPKACTYIKTGRFFKNRDGNYYEIVTSSTGASFYITEFDTRKYLSKAEKELPTYSEEELL